MSLSSDTKPTIPPVPFPSDSPADYEDIHVHKVYQSIAPHFSLTRHKPWPVVTSFLSTLPSGSVGVDLGCGNGKNLPSPLSADVFILASDRSASLVSICARDHREHEALAADLLAPPHPSGRFDFALCIAALHHLSTRERRCAGMKAILDVLRVPDVKGRGGGEALICVWAVEQGEGSRRAWMSGKGDGDEGDAGEGGLIGKDVLVPWVLKEKRTKGDGVGERARSGGAQSERNVDGDQVFQRYYHLSQEGELEDLVMEAGGVVVRAGYEKDNWWVVARRKSVAEGD